MIPRQSPLHHQLRRLLALTLSLFPCFLYASAPAELHARADTLKLADLPYWHLLLRYEPVHGGWESEARTPAFFLSTNGRTNPSAELHALLDGLYASPSSSTTTADSAVACRFPARTAWLKQQLQSTPSAPGLDIPSIACPEFTAWTAALRPTQATLVFASDYLNNPSSMFGHTFLRLDAPEQTQDTRLLAYAVNYAANVGESNPVSFAWNGLTGGYPGTFSLLPYYAKVKEYSDMENRDLWEYQLTLTPVELQRLLAYLWELRNVQFPYYFLTQNCSYQLLGLLEAARPGLDMRSAFPVQAIPTDTVRRVLAEPGMLRKLVYRPSAERRLLQDAHQRPASVNHAARVLADHPDAAVTLSATDTAAALETAYDYRYYRFLAGENTGDSSTDLRKLLLRRAAIPVPDNRSTPEQPAVDPASGHATARINLAAGRAFGANYLGLNLRPAYHDLLDSSEGYRRGAHIDFLDAELRLYNNHDNNPRLRLDHFSIIDIDSITPWDTFFRPWSWFIGFGQRQAAVNKQGNFSARESHGVAYIDGGAGGDLALNDNLECYAQLGISTETGPSLDLGWRVGSGPRVGCLYNQQRWRLRAQADSRYYNDIEGMETRATLEGQFDLTPRQALRLQIGLLRHNHGHNPDHNLSHITEPDRNSSSTAELAWLHYF
jgi:hypothetical protein